MNCSGVCGVDLIQDKEGVNYIVECNSNPGFKIEQLTGVNVAEKIIEFAERGKLSEAAIERENKFNITPTVLNENIISIEISDGEKLATMRYYTLDMRDYF
ncbi:hypothetical protein [Splendidivirga corallicola]|uniref:hypothetical protein n=1 Tax=Splendidivirga corallicola TaxID=3051826 RepID=UPI003211C4D6